MNRPTWAETRPKNRTPNSVQFFIAEPARFLVGLGLPWFREKNKPKNKKKLDKS